MATDPVVQQLGEIVGAGNVMAGGEAKDDYFHDEALGLEPVGPLRLRPERFTDRPIRRGRDRLVRGRGLD